jgi:hypothetical protein
MLRENSILARSSSIEHGQSVDQELTRKRRAEDGSLSSIS